ncbi:unannotated protein [freshwater metagenome]|uniref:Unannotated protein n=1 Tax=freshwater metagenome TaxID=449393 RepID=A0A6J6Q2D0_9ZZZZ
MIPASWPGLLRDPPLLPTPEDARSELRRELVRPEYHQRNPVQELLDWLGRTIDGTLQAASGTPPLATFAALVAFLLLVLGVGALVSRTRRSPRQRAGTRAVLADEQVGAAELRAHAETALAEGRYEDAVVDAYRALTVLQVERGLLDDAPGATAHEVARTLGARRPDLVESLESAARLFDEVLYGDRPADRDQALSVLAIDAAGVGAR